MSRFKIGDKVRILDGRNKPSRDFAWVTEMNELIGTVHTVERVYIETDHPVECVYSCGYGLSNTGYILVEKWLAPAEFTKYDFKEFDVVEFRNGNKTLVINDIILGELSIGGFYLANWTDDLRDKYTDKYDIMKIYRSTDSIPTDRSKWIDLPVVYERTEVKEMTIEEISEALGYEVKVVK